MDILLERLNTHDQELTAYLDTGIKNGWITKEVAQQYWFQNNALEAVLAILEKPLLGTVGEVDEADGYNKALADMRAIVEEEAGKS